VDEEKAEAPELPKAKINPLGSLIDDLPVAKGPNNPADAVNAALDKARAFDQPAPIPNPTPAATPVEGTPTEAGDAEGVYKRWPVSRVVVDGKGKALMAARPILAGAVIYQARPWISVVADSFMRSVCSHCFKSTTDEMQGGADAGPAPDLPFSCPSCAACGYCSVKCKEAAANVHAKECVSVAQVVKMTAGKTESRGPRMIIRALAQRAVDLEGGDAEAERKRQLNLPTFVDVCELVDHMNDLPPHKQKEFLSIAAGVGSLPIGKGVGRAELVRLVATLRCNSQAVVDVANQRKGDVLIAPADFNHSCTPNCTVAFYGNTMQVRALTEIEPDEELTIQYTDLYLPRAERRNKLESSHCFSCACPRCTEQGNQTADQRVEGFRCGVKKCDGLVPPPLPTATATATVGPGAAGAEKQNASWICVKCGQSHAHRRETLQRSAAAAKVLYTTAVETQRRGDFEAARSLLEKLISQHSSALFWQHAILYNAHHALFSACNALEDTEDAATAAAKALACLRAVYPPYHPVRLAVFEQRIVRFLARIADMRAHGARVTSGSGITDECPRSYRVASFPSLKRRRRRAAGRGNRMLPAVPRHSADLCG
jgi:SET and MYND domain-containing protein